MSNIRIYRSASQTTIPLAEAEVVVESVVVVVGETLVVDVEDVFVDVDVGVDVEEASPSQLFLSSPMVLNAVVLWFPSPCFSPSHLNIHSINGDHEMINQASENWL